MKDAHLGSRTVVSCLFAALAAAAHAPSAAAQCTDAPRLLVEDRTCALGQPCDVTIGLEAGGEDIASVAGRLTSTATFACDAACAPGDAAANGSCFANAENCAFNVADLSPPLTAFGDGAAAVLTVTCDTAGANAFDLSNVTFGDTSGSPVAGCGAGGTITCADPTPEALVAITKDKGINATTFNAGAFQIENRSVGAIRITSVTIDLAGSLLPDMVFDPLGDAGDILAKCLDPESGEAATGFVEPDDPCSDPFASEHDDGFFELTVGFDHFDPGEAFGFRVDVDPTSIRGATGSGAAGAVSGTELTGAVVTVAFDDGSTITSELFRQTGFNGGGLNIVKESPPAAPSLDALGISEPAVTDDATQTIRITGPAGATVRLLQIEGGVILEEAEGFDLDPFEANAALAVVEITAVIGAGGFVDVPVELLRDSNFGGLNYFVAVVVDPDGSGRTGDVSNVVVLSLGETCQDDASCDDGDPCTSESCDADDGCVRANASAGTACASDGNGCTDDVCDGSGACTHLDNAAPCDDGQFCNGADTCAAGACSIHGGDPCTGEELCDESGARCAECLSDNDCSALSDECNTGRCDLGSGTCFADPSAAGTVCTDDGNPCTDDACDGDGTCGHPNNADPCADDGNACTDDVCGGGACTHPDNSAPCDDGQFCNGADTCAGGSCSVHAGDPCSERCDEQADVCEDLECTDDLECAHLSTDCAEGRCNLASGTCFAELAASSTPCTDDLNDCTDDVCDGQGTCLHVNNTLPCDDGVFCNGADTCVNGSCSQHAGDPCDGTDGDADCSEQCDEGTAACTAPDPSGSACADDGNPCTDDRCDGAGACVPLDNSAPCDDGNFCTANDACVDGTCTGSGDPCEGRGCNEAADACVDCTSDEHCSSFTDACNDGNCDVDTGTCVTQAKADGTPCDDAAFCTVDDECTAGVCGGDARNCGDGIPCTADTCDDGADACTHLPIHGTCDDGETCTGEETCVVGQGCVSAGPPDCSELDDQCAFGTCDETAGGCVALAIDDGVPCEDGNACTIDDACGAGTCTGATFCGVPVSRGEKPTVSDALFILRTAVSLEECDGCECDVNADTRITTTDALVTLNVVVDLPVVLNCFAAVEPSTTTSVPGSTSTTTSTTTTSTTLSEL